VCYIPGHEQAGNVSNFLYVEGQEVPHQLVEDWLKCL